MDGINRARVIWAVIGIAIGLVAPRIPSWFQYATTTHVQLTLLGFVLVLMVPIGLTAWVWYTNLQRTKALTGRQESKLTEARELGRQLVRDVDRADALREAVDLVNAFIVEVDIETGTFVWANRKLEEFLGLNIAGRPVSWWMDDVVTEETRGRTLRFYDEIAESSSTRALSNALRGTNGRVFNVDWVSLPAHPRSNSSYSLGRCPNERPGTE